MTMYEEGRWLEERILLTERLERGLGITGLGGRPQRVVVLDRLAEELGFDPDRLRDSAYEILDELLDALAEVLFPDRLGVVQLHGSLIEDIDSGRVQRIIERTLAETPVDDVILAMIQFGWGNRRMNGSCAVNELAGEVRGIARGLLQERLVQMLGRWYKAQTWRERPERSDRPRYRRGA